MKSLNLVTSLFCIFIAGNISAQTPAAIEADLLKSFKKIHYWDGKHDTSVDARAANEKANEQFALKLKNYTTKYPSTIEYPFVSLTRAHLNILTSSDGLFRIYSWDTWMGGTMHFFENLFQIKAGGRARSILDTPRMEGDSRSYYDKLYTLKTGKNAYYLSTTLGIGSTKDYGRGIQIFSIANGKLNDDTRIIKTRTGFHSEINYEYDLALTDEKVTSVIHFDPKTESIYVPVVLGKGKLTNNYIIYKFSGQYFERVNN